MSSQSTLLGAAGEHHVMTALLRRGFISALELAPQGIPNADILVADIEGSRMCAVQVKTRRDIGTDGGWHVKAKHESNRAERLFYCFVDFARSSSGGPKVHVLPCVLVADVLAASHRRWLDSPGKRGAHRDGPMRRFRPDYTNTFGVDNNPYPQGWLDPYRDAWNLLSLQPLADDLADDASTSPKEGGL